MTDETQFPDSDVILLEYVIAYQVYKCVKSLKLKLTIEDFSRLVSFSIDLIYPNQFSGDPRKIFAHLIKTGKIVVEGTQIYIMEPHFYELITFSRIGEDEVMNALFHVFHLAKDLKKQSTSISQFIKDFHYIMGQVVSTLRTHYIASYVRLEGSLLAEITDNIFVHSDDSFLHLFSEQCYYEQYLEVLQVINRVLLTYYIDKIPILGLRGLLED